MSRNEFSNCTIEKEECFTPERFYGNILDPLRKCERFETDEKLV